MQLASSVNFYKLKIADTIACSCLVRGIFHIISGFLSPFAFDLWAWSNVTKGQTDGRTDKQARQVMRPSRSAALHISNYDWRISETTVTKLLHKNHCCSSWDKVFSRPYLYVSNAGAISVVVVRPSVRLPVTDVLWLSFRPQTETF